MVSQKKSLKECCEILNIDISNSRNENEIKRAYHKLAIKWHPDKNIGKEKNLCEAKFKDLVEAYDILTDPVKRSQAEYESRKKELFTKGFVTVARTTKFDGSLFGGGAKFARQGTNPGLIQISQKSRNFYNSSQNTGRNRKVSTDSGVENYSQISEKLFTGINTIYETVTNVINGNESSVNAATSKIIDIKNAILNMNILKKVTADKQGTEVDNPSDKEGSTVSCGSEIWEEQESSVESEVNVPYLSSNNQNLPDYRLNKISNLNIPDYRTPNYINRQTVCSGSDGPHMFGNIRSSFNAASLVNNGGKNVNNSFEKIHVRHAQKKVVESKNFSEEIK
ncbi:hypothetical protein FG386_000371 [Cryptosporidium ryanae]|uniref:uncharacterized protein n=1 Tax=Cryptosporidium ryanae TaxID=515981 RepID=UPI00351A476F|nr:hypothetical protein FG386_000371 [Cryptosporidium ryanae]